MIVFLQGFLKVHLVFCRSLEIKEKTTGTAGIKPKFKFFHNLLKRNQKYSSLYILKVLNSINICWKTTVL